MKLTHISILNSSVILALCVMVLLLAFQSYKQKREIKYHIMVNESKDDMNRSSYIDMMTTFYQNECSNIESDLSVLSYNDQQNLPLRSVFVEDEYLVVRISKNDCTSCLDSLYKLIGNAFLGIENPKIIVLTDEPNARKALVYQRMQGANYPIYKIRKGLLPNSFDKETPYLFIMSTNGKIEMLHKIDVKSFISNRSNFTSGPRKE